MSDESNALGRIFKETSEFIIIGLTGRTGSGCTTAAEILSKENISIPEKSSFYTATNDKLKYKIIRNYININWKQFIKIQMRDVITGILLELNYSQLIELISKSSGDEIKIIEKKLIRFKQDYEAAHNKIKTYKAMPEDQKNQKKDMAWEIYFEYLPEFCIKFKETLQNKLGIGTYTSLYQYIGDNIRASGSANNIDFDADKIFTLPKIVNQLIKVIRGRNANGAYIVIDAIRNPFEAVYFHQRYSGFYLISINTPNDERLKHLRNSHKFSEKQIAALDKKEYPEKLSGKHIYTSQNIQKCIEISDIHINNPDRQEFNTNELKFQLSWYISLILHPGLVTPTAIERGMQLAYSAKLNSGCISRQVGAVVTDKNYSVKAVGWNSTPEGQTPCQLRSADDLLGGGENEIYSNYERTDKNFQKVMQNTFENKINPSLLIGRPLSYCFKDIQNEIDGEKNQVHTRSLHAEENAFLQIAKYGGEAIKGGVLFTTASPCELCAKKAYQLGIKKVVFIDPYPGISKQHILSAGTNSPELILFRGAIGRAYHRLYQPLLAYKDELKMLTGYVVNGGKGDKDKKIALLEEEIRNLKAEKIANKSVDDSMQSVE